MLQNKRNFGRLGIPFIVPHKDPEIEDPLTVFVAYKYIDGELNDAWLVSAQATYKRENNWAEIKQNKARILSLLRDKLRSMYDMSIYKIRFELITSQLDHWLEEQEAEYKATRPVKVVEVEEPPAIEVVATMDLTEMGKEALLKLAWGLQLPAKMGMKVEELIELIEPSDAYQAFLQMKAEEELDESSEESEESDEEELGLGDEVYDEPEEDEELDDEDDFSDLDELDEEYEEDEE